MQTTDCMQPYLLGRCATKMLNVFDTAGFEHARNVTMCHKHSRGNSFRFMVSLRSRRLHHVGISFRFIHCLYVFCMSFGIKAGQMSLFKLKMNQRLKKKKNWNASIKDAWHSVTARVKPWTLQWVMDLLQTKASKSHLLCWLIGLDWVLSWGQMSVEEKKQDLPTLLKFCRARAELSYAYN